jgi:hypothetical protein
VPAGCINADLNGDNRISAGELTHVITDIINLPPSGCPVVPLH